MADELAALLDAAAVPGPYVVVGHSNGGMVAQLYAANHAEQIAGIVLVDSATEDQDLRAAELIRSQRPAEQAEAMIAGMTAMPPRLIDPEQFDHPTSREQLRASRTNAPLPTVPMTVLVHGLPSTTSHPTWPGSTSRSGRTCNANSPPPCPDPPIRSSPGPATTSTTTAPTSSPTPSTTSSPPPTPTHPTDQPGSPRTGRTSSPMPDPATAHRAPAIANARDGGRSRPAPILGRSVPRRGGDQHRTAHHSRPSGLWPVAGEVQGTETSSARLWVSRRL